MDELIPIVNKLQDVFNTVSTQDVQLPQIVVVGTQSSGKSSVIEHIVQRDFLPRGVGVVTKRPLILQLINIEDQKNIEWGEFLHKKGQQFTDFEQIKEEIIKETDRVCSERKGICPLPINLKIYSPKVLNLTLVDLPGITKLPVGDQPSDIEQQVRDLIFSYITNPNSIILSICAANVDIANSESLKISREVDPKGLRTLGVLTKLDLMDSGTDAMDILLGKVIPLKLGFVGVVLRSQQDILNRKPINEALTSEAEFFKNHPIYKTIHHKCDTHYLAKTLNMILIKHIQTCLPEMKNRISTMISETQEELKSYGDPVFDNKTSQGALLLQITSNFCQKFNDSIDGRFQDLNMSELYGGARISYIFHEVFSKSLDEISPFDNLDDMDIRTAMRNATGPRPSLFVPEVSFDLLVRRQINRLEEPALQCVDMAFEELQKVAIQCETPELSRFKGLQEKLSECVCNLLSQKLTPTRQMVSNLVAIELSYINTNHPDFIGGSNAISQLLEHRLDQQEFSDNSKERHYPNTTSSKKHLVSKLNSTFPLPLSSHSVSNHSLLNYYDVYSESDIDSPIMAGYHLPPMPSTVLPSAESTDREKIETVIIKSLIESYFNIVRKNIQDSVPKAIMYFLVHASKNQMQSELVRALYKEEDFTTILKEAPEIAEKRKACIDLTNILKRAMKLIIEVRDYSVLVDT